MGGRHRQAGMADWLLVGEDDHRGVAIRRGWPMLADRASGSGDIDDLARHGLLGGEHRNHVGDIGEALAAGTESPGGHRSLVERRALSGDPALGHPHDEPIGH
ncbi:MAG: hypothetical protein ABEJ35_07895 [Halobacteriaceae archaeon]